MRCGDLDSFFEKKFTFECQEEWILPAIDLISVEDVWSLKPFELLKLELNHVKSALNDKGEKWHNHTSYVNKAALVKETIRNRISPDILTQAWCKFYEILSKYLLIYTDSQNFQSLHLCEAPGAFISALNCYLYLNHPELNWEWLANTLHPYYEGQNIKNVIVDDRLIFPTLRRWHFGKDGTGDITSPNYHKDFCLSREGKELFDLVTADGSINCLENPAEQELVVADLHFSEVLVALSHLAIGGSFVLKKFTFFECETICTMYFLNCAFEKIHVFKPFTSTHGNSEVYVVCLGYHGVHFIEKYIEVFSQVHYSRKDKALFPLSSMPESFLSQLLQCSKYFIELQKSAILENIELFSKSLSSYNTELQDIQKKCAEKFLIKCNILSSDDYEIPGLYKSKNQILTSFYDPENRNCKTLYFQALGETFENLEKLKTMNWDDKVLDVEKRLKTCFPASRKRQHKDIEWCFVHKEVINRMNSKSYVNWSTTGKKILVIKNSKFCNPMLLYLWNRIANEPQIEIQSHQLDKHSYWDFDALLPLITEGTDSKEFCLIFLQKFTNEKSEKDPLLDYFLEAFKNSFACDFSNIENEKDKLSVKNRIMFINTLYWENSLHQEIIIKHRLTEVLRNVIKVMNIGDSMIICLQSLFTRYTIGLLFMLLSLFEKFVCLLPNDIAPATCGQLWVFKNYKKPSYTNRLINYMERILHLDIPETYEILEIVPIASLCGGYFYEYLLSTNNRHMLQRLQSLISIEKSKRNL